METREQCLGFLIRMSRPGFYRTQSMEINQVTDQQITDLNQHVFAEYSCRFYSLR